MSWRRKPRAAGISGQEVLEKEGTEGGAVRHACLLVDGLRLMPDRGIGGAAGARQPPCERSLSASTARSRSAAVSPQRSNWASIALPRPITCVCA